VGVWVYGCVGVWVCERLESEVLSAGSALDYRCSFVEDRNIVQLGIVWVQKEPYHAGLFLQEQP